MSNFFNFYLSTWVTAIASFELQEHIDVFRGYSMDVSYVLSRHWETLLQLLVLGGVLYCVVQLHKINASLKDQSSYLKRLAASSELSAKNTIDADMKTCLKSFMEIIPPLIQIITSLVDPSVSPESPTNATPTQSLSQPRNILLYDPLNDIDHVTMIPPTVVELPGSMNQSSPRLAGSSFDQMQSSRVDKIKDAIDTSDFSSFHSHKVLSMRFEDPSPELKNVDVMMIPPVRGIGSTDGGKNQAIETPQFGTMPIDASSVSPFPSPVAKKIVPVVYDLPDSPIRKLVDSAFLPQVPPYTLTADDAKETAYDQIFNEVYDPTSRRSSEGLISCEELNKSSLKSSDFDRGVFEHVVSITPEWVVHANADYDKWEGVITAKSRQSSLSIDQNDSSQTVAGSEFGKIPIEVDTNHPLPSTGTTLPTLKRSPWSLQQNFASTQQSFPKTASSESENITTETPGSLGVFSLTPPPRSLLTPPVSRPPPFPTFRPNITPPLSSDKDSELGETANVLGKPPPSYPILLKTGSGAPPPRIPQPCTTHASRPRPKAKPLVGITNNPFAQVSH